MSDNPLKSIYRSKSIYLKLPSQGKFYPSGVKLSVDNEIGVMSMTTTDEINLKSPDALFNGEALFDLIKSCVPDIENPRELPVCDLDAILTAIRMATNGNNMDISSQCPECKKESDYSIDLGQMLGSIVDETKNTEVEVDGAVVYVRPYRLDSQMKGNIHKFHTARMERVLNNETMGHAEREQIFNEALATASALTVSIVTENIDKVVITKDDSPIEVTNKDHILDWVKNMDTKTYNLISNHIKQLSQSSLNNTFSVVCEHCQQKYNTELELDPVSFFI